MGRTVTVDYDFSSDRLIFNYDDRKYEIRPRHYHKAFLCEEFSLK